MNEHIVVFITAGSMEEADKLSRGMVEGKLAFCTSSVPGIKSTYYWEGKVHVDQEILLIVKTRSDLFGELESWVRKNHSYSVPEIIAIPLAKGSLPYLKCIDDWVSKNG